MRLVNYGIGEIADRLSILALKRLHKDEAANGHWKIEQDVLEGQLAKRRLNSASLMNMVELTAVNSAIWHAEDDLRELRTQSAEHRAQWAGFGRTWTEEIASLAIRIQELNDRRAMLIHDINVVQGDGHGKEKG